MAVLVVVLQRNRTPGSVSFITISVSFSSLSSLDLSSMFICHLFHLHLYLYLYRQRYCETLAHTIVEAKQFYDLLFGSCRGRAIGIIQSESGGPRTRAADGVIPRPRAKTTVSAQSGREGTYPPSVPLLFCSGP